MSRYQSHEILRLAPEDTNNDTVLIPDWASSLIITNPLDAAVQLAWREHPRAGFTTGYDVIVPGASFAVVPIPFGVGIKANIRVNYSGLGFTPADDENFVVTVVAHECLLQPYIGMIS